MGVSLSRSSERTAEAKYIHSIDTKESSGENDEFLNQCTKGKTIKGSESTSKRTETAFFQFKTTKSNCWDTFDSLDTIISRKSVPFAVLPDGNPQALPSSAVGEEDITSFQPKGGAVTQSTSGDKFLEDLDDKFSTEKNVEEITGTNREKTGENVTQRVTALLKKKAERDDGFSLCTKSWEKWQVGGHVDDVHKEARRSPRRLGNTAHVSVPLSHRKSADGRGTKRESVPDLTTARPHSETEIVCPSNDFGETKRQSVPDLTMVRTDSETGTVYPCDNYQVEPSSFHS